MLPILIAKTLMKANNMKKLTKLQKRVFAN
jgi:hypothetical protein